MENEDECEMFSLLRDMELGRRRRGVCGGPHVSDWDEFRHGARSDPFHSLTKARELNCPPSLRCRGFLYEQSDGGSIPGGR
jgi:hypothetical protein